MIAKGLLKYMLLYYGCQRFPMVSETDRKSTRLNSSHLVISYAVFCLKKKIVLSAIAIVVNTVWADPRNGLYGIGGALVGVPVFFLWRKWGGTPSSTP